MDNSLRVYPVATYEAGPMLRLGLFCLRFHYWATPESKPTVGRRYTMTPAQMRTLAKQMLKDADMLEARKTG
jgi:hypothetical protein